MNLSFNFRKKRGGGIQNSLIQSSELACARGFDQKHRLFVPSRLCGCWRIRTKGNDDFFSEDRSTNYIGYNSITIPNALRMKLGILNKMLLIYSHQLPHKIASVYKPILL